MIAFNAWLLASILLLPPLAVPVVVALRGNANQRLVGIQLASLLTSLILAAMTFAFDQSSFIDLAFGATLLGVSSTFLFAIFMERWL